MDKKTTGIVSYFTIIGWLIAYFAGDRKGAKFHLNQSLIVIIAGVVASVCRYVPFIGGTVSWALHIVVFILWILGLVAACEGKEKELPVIGSIQILK